MYCASAAFVGVAQLYVGVVPYSTIHVCSVVPFQFLNVIKYLFVVLLNCAVIVQSHVNFVPLLPHVFVHPLNVYVYCVVAAAGVAVTSVPQIVTLFPFTTIFEL